MHQTLHGLSRSAAVACMAISLLAGCAGPGETRPRSASSGGARFASCSTRLIVHLRQGTGIRSDFELVEAGRRAGIQLEVVQTMGRSSRLVMIRGMGPEQVCEAAAEQLAMDPRIDSVQHF